MAQAQDILLDDLGDIVITNGNMVLGASDGQHIQHILELEPGELKENPLVGCSIQKKINGEQADGELRRMVTLQLQADGYQLNTPVFIKGENIVIDAERNS